MRTPFRLILVAFALFATLSATVAPSTAHADEAEGRYRTGLALKKKGDLAGATRVLPIR